MISRFKGTTPLALLAKDLAIRARIGLALLGGRLALAHLKSSPALNVGCAVFEVVRRWFDGERFDPDQFRQVLDPECGRGTSWCAADAKSAEEKSAWQALDSAVAYIAFHAYREVRHFPSAGLSEVDETELDHIDNSLRAISPSFMQSMATAAAYLKREPNASFVQLKSAAA
jgi:hypothetical protein